LRARYDVSVYLDTPEPLRHRWKVARDTAKRGYSATQVHELLGRRESVSQKYIRPQREHADMVVRFHPDSSFTDYEHLHATVTMRPTLDQPDLRAVIDSCPLAASALRLTRDGESEALEIDGRISAEQAAEVERELWSRRPELERLLMARTGNFIENGATRHSHALAIAQLLLTYPVLRARLTKERSGS
jgi:phosphoribulokinase